MLEVYRSKIYDMKKKKLYDHVLEFFNLYQAANRIKLSDYEAIFLYLFYIKTIHRCLKFHVTLLLRI
jgi:hypothetical protein